MKHKRKWLIGLFGIGWVFFAQSCLRLRMRDDKAIREFSQHGDKDPLVPPPNAVYAKEKLINAQLVKLIWLKEANHFIPWNRYDDVKAVLLHLTDTPKATIN
jgi:pimeloyl-ACP methyl ester carboxylesterase